MKFNLKTLLSFYSVTFLQESADGALPSESPGGPTINPSGVGLRPASRSLSQEKVKGQATSDTSGLSFSALSESASLVSSLVSRLKQRLTTDGSILFKMTWKEKATPSGRSVYLLRASAHRTSGKGCGSWPTPTKTDSVRAPSENFTTTNITLNHAAILSAWPTPTTRDFRDGGECKNVEVKSILGRVVWLVSGATPSGSPAATEKKDRLNPQFSRWLMGYPDEWANSAPTETPSSRKSVRNS